MSTHIDSDGDFKIITKVLSGSTESFAILVEKYQTRLQTFCAQMLSSKEAGRDATQEVFIKAFKSLKHYKMDASFSAWLFQISRNHCIDVLRRRKRQAESEFLEDIHSSYIESNNLSIITEARDLTTKILYLLPLKYREIILLREAHEMTYEEIAKITKVSVDSVKGKLKRARKEIVEIIEELESNNSETFKHTRGKVTLLSYFKRLWTE